MLQWEWCQNSLIDLLVLLVLLVLLLLLLLLMTARRIGELRNSSY